METRRERQAEGLKCTFSAAQWLGERGRQEDAWIAERIDFEESGAGGVFFAVADGMGGENRGDMASRVAIEAFAQAFRNSAIRDIGERLRAALEAANFSIAAAVKREPLHAGMGTTLLGCCVAGDRIYWASSGDSLLLLVRNEEARRLNADHSFGALKHDPEFARGADPDTPDSALFSCLTGDPVALVDLESRGCPLLAGDTVVAASDGLETLGEEDLTRCLNVPDRPAERLIERVRAHAARGQDNVTAIVLNVGIDRPAADFIRRAWPGTRAVATHAAALLAGGVAGFAIANLGSDREPPLSAPGLQAPQAGSASAPPLQAESPAVLQDPETGQPTALRSPDAESPAAPPATGAANPPPIEAPEPAPATEPGFPGPDGSEPTAAGGPEK